MQRVSNVIPRAKHTRGEAKGYGRSKLAIPQDKVREQGGGDDRAEDGWPDGVVVLDRVALEDGPGQRRVRRRAAGPGRTYVFQGDGAEEEHAGGIGDRDEGADREGKGRVHAGDVVDRDKVEETGRDAGEDDGIVEPLEEGALVKGEDEDDGGEGKGVWSAGGHGR
jgi:hypothetical protein